MTRAKLNRLDGQKIGAAGLTRRDREIREMEDALRDSFKKNMTEDELEQLKMSEQHDKAALKALKAKK